MLLAILLFVVALVALALLNCLIERRREHHWDIYINLCSPSKHKNARGHHEIMRPPLPPMPPAAAAALRAQLRRQGFAVASLQPSLRPWIRDALRGALINDAAAMDEFRFPPLEGPIVYDESKRRAFRALFEVATNCLEGLLSLDCRDRDGSTHYRGSCNSLREALRQVRSNDDTGPRLFAHNDDEPSQPGMPFSQSFFNLFNYDHGSLNAHVDRSLLTVIYSVTPDVTSTQQQSKEEEMQRSALWVKDNEGVWHYADQSAGVDEVVIMAGEDLEATGIASHLGLFAAEHAVRVDPYGERIERSHFRRDPKCTEGVGHRTSAAMILRHELE